MCGICGLAASDPSALPLEMDTLRAMTDVIRHRGPDDEGWRVEPGVALGARRLSIIDLPGSHQPVSNEDGTIWTVFNGEIYNFAEIRESLLRNGHRLRTSGDTETIVHLYEEEGPDFVRRLRGMFALAVWDAPRRRLVLARDRMGVKPLYIAKTPAGLAFASELKSLLVGRLIAPRLDPAGAELFGAFGYVPGPTTLLEGVSKLDPATYLVWEDGRETQRSVYWTPFDTTFGGVGEDPREDAEQLAELLRRAVRSRMIADVPLGVMLSGGLDSSVVTALMAEASTGPVETFSIGFVEDPGSNELADARRVAEGFRTSHHELLMSARHDPELVDEGLWYLEEPIVDLSFLGMLLLSRLVREHVTVALSGQGADELLAGYRKHQVTWAADHLSRLPTQLQRLVTRAGGSQPSGAVSRTITALTTDDPATRFLAMSRVVGGDRWRSLYRSELSPASAEGLIAGAVNQRLPGRDLSILRQMLYLDAQTALVDKLLLYFDKMSMASSLEVRVPFMDHDVVSFCAALPDARRLSLRSRLRGKHILREVGKELVGAETLAKPKRGFFRSAVAAWLESNAEHVREVLLDERTLDRGLYRRDGVQHMLDPGAGKQFRRDEALLSLYLLEKWQRLFIDATLPSPARPRPLVVS